MLATEDLVKAILADKSREARRRQLVRQALQARDEQGARPVPQPEAHREARFFRWEAIRRPLRALGWA